MIPEKLEDREKEAQIVAKRYASAKRYWTPWYERWVRYFKIWRNLLDAVEEIDKQDAEEPNSFVPYAFSMVEDLCARVGEPHLKSKLPCRPTPIRPGDEKQAENFATMARSYFSTGDYQLEFMSGVKNRVITGNQPEMDVWRDDWVIGKRWSKVKTVEEKEVVVNVGGQEVPTVAPTAVEKWALVDDKHPISVGYQCEQLSPFLVHWQPEVRDSKKVRWVCVEEQSVPISVLQQAMTLDPETGEKVPMFFLDDLIAAEKGQSDKRIRARDVFSETDYLRLSMEAIAGGNPIPDQHEDDGIDRVHLVHEFQPDGTVRTLAQGKYLIRKWVNPVAGLPVRNRVYTIDSQFLIGIGAIEPIEDMVYEFNDVHNLSFANWLRIVNRMLAVKMDGLVDEDDLVPRPGGVIRFEGTGSIGDHIREFTQPDVAGSMLTMESNLKGIIEKASASSDLSPGVMGTKQDHNTATGVLEIQRNMAVRMSVNRRIDMANFQKQMWRMERYYSFYQFEPMPFTAYGPDGNTSVAYLSNEDIYTDGRGFNFIVEEDPSFGDDFIQRQQLRELWEMGAAYEQWRTTIGGPEAPKLQAENLFRRIAKNFGFEDTTFLLKKPDGVMDPETETQIMLAGGQVQVNPRENMVRHLATHLNTRNSPEFIQGIQSGKIPPEVVAAYDEHINITAAALRGIVNDPLAYAEQIKIGEIAERAPLVPGKPNAQA